MHSKITITTVAAIGFALAACGSADRNESSATDNALTVNEVGTIDNNMMAANNMSAAAPAPTDAAGFAAAIAASDKFEIDSSKLAEAQASDAKVKAFAATLVKDHTKSTADLKSIAGKENMTLAPPTLDADMQAKLDALKMTSGGEFDRLYLSQQVAAHESALNLLQGFAATGENAALKGFATNVTPVIQKHLDEARNLSK